MLNSSFSGLCDHSRIKRLNENFVRCTKCGQSMIRQEDVSMNKNGQEFARENKSFQRNFDRNFSNVIEEVDRAGPAPIDFFINPNNNDYLIVDRTVMNNSNPPKFKINYNGNITVATNDQVNEISQKIKAIRVDQEQFKYLFKK